MSKCRNRQRLSVAFALVWLLLNSPLSLAGQVVSSEAKALLEWMDEYVKLPAGPDQDDLPRFVPGWFEEIELRSETDEFQLNRQRYVLRAEPKLPHVRRAERRVQNAQRAGLNGLGEDVRADGRSDALAHLFELATDLREAALMDTLFHVQSRLVDVTRLRVVEPDYDIEKILDAEDELSEITLRLKELEALNKSISPPVLPKSLVQLEDIRFRLLSLANDGPSTTTDQVNTLEKIDAELALERAENLSFLKFLQVEYRSTPDPEDLTRELVSVGGSISFPRRERHIRQVDELKIERLEEIYDFALKKREREREFEDSIIELQRMLEVYDDLKVQIQARRQRRDRLGQTYLQSSEARPESLLRLSRRNLSDRLNLLQLEEDVREGYASLLGDYVTLDEQGIQRWVLR